MTSYKGFSPEDKKKMEEAVEKAKKKLKEQPCCYPSAPKVHDKLEKATFVYKKDLEDCGKVTPWGYVTSAIQVGPAAFGPSCCSLESTLAHEANHLLLKGATDGEKSSYDLEKKCFGCGAGTPP